MSYRTIDFAAKFERFDDHRAPRAIAANDVRV